MHPDLEAALTPLLRDLQTCGVQPKIEPWSGEDGLVGVWLREPDGTGAVVAVRIGRPLTEEMVELADRIQDWAVEALNAVRRPAVWPECPRHPDSHPLAPDVIDGEPMWLCPRDGVPVTKVGHLQGR